MKIVKAVSGVPIRLTPERMAHIARRHPEMEEQEDRIMETLAEPDMIQEGDVGCAIALRHYAETPVTEKSCVVVYRETGPEDGFVLTAYFTGRPAAWRRILWKR